MVRRYNNNITYGTQLLIDTSVFTDNTYINRNTSINHNLNSIEKTITLTNRTYILAGVIHYISYGGNRSGHYVAFTFAGTHWYLYDDLKKKREVANPMQANPHVIIYMRN